MEFLNKMNFKKIFAFPVLILILLMVVSLHEQEKKENEQQRRASHFAQNIIYLILAGFCFGAREDFKSCYGQKNFKTLIF